MCLSAGQSRVTSGQLCSQSLVWFWILNLSMDLLWIILFLVCAGADRVMEVEVTPGQNITLTCSEKKTDIYWYLQIFGRLQGLIGRTFSRKPEKTFSLLNAGNKFCLQENRLHIQNITTEDFRHYFCAKRMNASISTVDSFLLVSGSRPALSTNHSKPQTSHNGTKWQRDHLLYGSVTLNVFLILVITGLVSALLLLKRKNGVYQVNSASPGTRDNTERPQYEEIQFSPVSPAAAPPECIYFKAQLPRPTMPHL